MSSFKRKSVKGVVWSAAERFSVQGIQFVLAIILARLVMPSEYGLIAMINIFMAIAQSFVDSGFSNALIQKKERTEVDFSTVFYFNISISLFFYLIIYIGAPYIAVFYNEPVLKDITRWIGLNIILSGLSVVQRAKLTVKVDFKTQAKASLISVVVSGGVAVYMAYNGFGVWSLVAQSLLNTLLNTVLLWFFSKWKPLIVFSLNSFRTLFSFGSKLLLSGLLNTIYTHMYSLVIGRYYSSADVGFYNRAFQFANFPSTNIVLIISRAIYPIQCEIQDDEERLNSSFIKYLRASCFIVFPLMTSLMILSKPLILVLLTEKWLYASDMLSILCFAYMWYPVMVINNQILNVKGRSDYFLKAEIWKKIFAFAILFITLPFGVKILCVGIVIYNFIDMAIIIFYSRKVIKTGYFIQIRNILPIFLLSATMGICMSCGINLLENNPMLQLVVGVIIAIIAIPLFGSIFKIKEIKYIISLKRR